MGTDWRKIATWHWLRIQRFLTGKQLSRGPSRNSGQDTHTHIQCTPGSSQDRFDLINPGQQFSGSVTCGSWQGGEDMIAAAVNLNTGDWVWLFYSFNISFFLSSCYSILRPTQQCEKAALLARMRQRQQPQEGGWRPFGKSTSGQAPISISGVYAPPASPKEI